MARMTVKAFKNGKQVAAFATELWARRFAIRFTILYPGTIEIHHHTGIIGQYTKGETSEEFRGHHTACFVGIAE